MTTNSGTTWIPRHIILAPFPRRGYASDSTLPPPQGSLKPKAQTPLRRTAYDSLSIRANPKPTQSEIQPILTLATSERYLLTRLRTRLPPTARILHDAYWVPKWCSNQGEDVGEGEGRREGEVFIFSNGSFVCWGLGEEDAMRFRRDVLTPARAEVGPLAEPETEELEFATDPSECVFIYLYVHAFVLSSCVEFVVTDQTSNTHYRKTRLQGDLIILGGSPKLTDPENLPDSLPPSAFPRETVLARYAFSQALSRSTALSALEASLEDYLSSMSSLPRALEKTGKPGMGRRALVKKLGELLRFRQGLNLNRENFSETPDFYWDHPVLEGKCGPLYFHLRLTMVGWLAQGTSIR
jgi:required for meiotic nuclear division protein 1